MASTLTTVARFAAVAFALMAEAARAQQVAGVAASAAHEAGQRTTFINRPEVSAQPQSLYIAPEARTKLRVHQGDWGVFNRDGGSASGFGPVGRYGAVRWAEDWQFLRDSALRKADNDPFDLLKYIPLTRDGAIYLTFSGEERLKNWFENRPSMGTVKPNDSGRVTLRSIYGADLHLGPSVRLYGEVINAAAAGWRGYGYNQGYRTRLDLQQGFVQLTHALLGAKSGLMIGRMDYVDAPQYMFYLRTVSSVPESWNGVRSYMIWPRVRIDLVDFVQTNINPVPIFHDTPSWSNRLWGGYASYAVPDFRFAGGSGHVFLDAFYYGNIFNGAQAALANPTGTGTLTGASRRDNYGLRLWGKAGPVEFSFGAIYQAGHEYLAAGSRPVSAYALNESIGWRFSTIEGHPFLGLQGDLYSGGNIKKSSGSIGTYVVPYVPISTYLDSTSYLGPSNLIAVAPNGSVTLNKAMLLHVKVPFFWRDSTDDSVYAPTFIYKLPKFSGGYVGVTPQATLAVRLGRHLTWNHDVGRFLASRSIAKAGASSATYYLSTLTFDF